MTRKRRIFGSVFKAKVALAAVRGDKTTTQLASEYSVHTSQFVEATLDQVQPRTAGWREVHVESRRSANQR